MEKRHNSESASPVGTVFAAGPEELAQAAWLSSGTVAVPAAPAAAVAVDDVGADVVTAGKYSGSGPADEQRLLLLDP